MASSLLALPEEVLINIVGSIGDVQDIANFLLVSRRLASLAQGPHLWADLARRDFDCDDAIVAMSPRERQITFINYARVLERGLAPRGRHPPPRAPTNSVVRVLRPLIAGAWAAPQALRPLEASKNLEWLARFARGIYLFRDCLSGRRTYSLWAVNHPEPVVLQLVLSHLRFAPNRGSQANHYSFPSSRELAYAAPAACPMFDAGTVMHPVHGIHQPTARNPPCLRLVPATLLHIMNVWHHHLVSESDPMGHIYWNLDARYRMSAWTERITAAEVSVKSTYLGFACRPEEGPNLLRTACNDSLLNSVRSKRAFMHGEDRAIRELREDPKLNEMHITSVEPLPGEEYDSTIWPNFLENAMRVFTNGHSFARGFLQRQLGLLRDRTFTFPTPMSPDIRHRQFMGYGREGDCHFVVAGVVTPMNNQYGFPGFQRFTMCKIYLSPPGSDDSASPYPPPVNARMVLRSQGLTGVGHEGVVLPGGRIIVGRWFNLDHTTNAGQGVNLVLPQQMYTDTSVRTRIEDAEGQGAIDSGPFIFWAPKHSQNAFAEAGTNT